MTECFHTLPKWTLYHTIFKNIIKSMSNHACFQDNGCAKLTYFVYGLQERKKVCVLVEMLAYWIKKWKDWSYKMVF